MPGNSQPTTDADLAAIEAAILEHTRSGASEDNPILAALLQRRSELVLGQQPLSIAA